MKKQILGIMGKAGAGKDTVADIIIKELGKDKIDKPIKYSFADPLKKMCAYVFDIPEIWMYDQDLKKREVNISLNNWAVKQRMVFWVEKEIANKDKWKWHLARPELSGRSAESENRCEDVANAILSKLFDVLFKLAEKGKASKLDGMAYRVSIRLLLQYMGTEVIRDMIDQNFWGEIKVSVSGVVVIPDCRFQTEVDFIMKSGGRILVVGNPDLKDQGMSHSSEEFVERITEYMGQRQASNNWAFPHLITNNLKNDYTSLKNQVLQYLYTEGLK